MCRSIPVLPAVLVVMASLGAVKHARANGGCPSESSNGLSTISLLATPLNFSWAGTPLSGRVSGTLPVNQSGAIALDVSTSAIFSSLAPWCGDLDYVELFDVTVTFGAPVSVLPGSSSGSFISTFARSSSGVEVNQGWPFVAGGGSTVAPATSCGVPPQPSSSFNASEFVINVSGTALSVNAFTLDTLCRARLSAPPGYQCAPSFGSGVSLNLRILTTVPTPVTIIWSRSLVGIGSTQQVPILPASMQATPSWNFRAPSAAGSYWYDPPMAAGFRFATLDGGSFARIDDFPSGIDADDQFVVRAAGSTLGIFGPGQACDFAALLGAGVAEFEVLGIDPLVEADDFTAFPLKLSLSAPNAQFSMTPIL